MSSSDVNIEERGVGGSDFNPWRITFQEIVEEEVQDGKKAKDCEAKDESKNKSEDEKGSEIQQDKVKSDSPVEEESRQKVLTPGARKFFEPSTIDPAEGIIKVVNILKQNLSGVVESKEELNECAKSEIYNNIYPNDNIHTKVDKSESDSSFIKATNENDIIENVFRASRGEMIKLDKKLQNSVSRPKSCRTIILDGDQSSELAVKKTQKSFINAADFCETIMDDGNVAEIELGKQKKENELNVSNKNSYISSFRRLPTNSARGNSSNTNKKSHHLSVMIQKLSQKSLHNRDDNGVHNGFSNSRVQSNEPQKCVINLRMAKSGNKQEKSHIKEESKEPVYLKQSHAFDKLLLDAPEKKPARRARKNSPVKKVTPKVKKTDISAVEEHLINGITKNFKSKEKVPDTEKPISNGKKTSNNKRSSGSNVSPQNNSHSTSQSISPDCTDVYEFCEDSALKDQKPLRYHPISKSNHETYENQEDHKQEAAETLLLIYGAPNNLHNETKSPKNKKRGLRNEQAIMVNKENSFGIMKESNEHPEKDDPSIYEMRNLKKTLPTAKPPKLNSHTMEATQSKETPRVRTRAQNIRQKEMTRNESLIEDVPRPSKKRWNNSITQKDDVTASFSLPKAIDLNRTGFGIKSGKNNKKDPSFEKLSKGRKSRKPSLNSNMNTYEDILSSSIGNKPDHDSKESKQKEEAVQQITSITLKPDPVDLNGVRSVTSLNKPRIFDKDVEVLSMNKQLSQHNSEDPSTKRDEQVVTSKDLKESEKIDPLLNHFGETKDEEIKEGKIVPTQKTRVSGGRKCKKFVRNRELRGSKTDAVAVSSAFPVTQPTGYTTVRRNKEDKNSASFTSAQPTEGTRTYNSEVIEDPKHIKEDINLNPGEDTKVQSSPVSDVDVSILGHVSSTVEDQTSDCQLKETVSSIVEDQTSDSQFKETLIFGASLENEAIAEDSLVKESINLTNFSQVTGDNTIKCTSWVEEYKNSFPFPTSPPENKTKDTCAIETKKNEIKEGVNSTEAGNRLEGRNAATFLDITQSREHLNLTDKIHALSATADSSHFKKDDITTRDTSYSQNMEEPNSTSFPDAISTGDTSSLVNKCPYSTSFPPVSSTDDIRTDSCRLSEAENSIALLPIHSKGDVSSINFLSSPPAENKRTDNSPVKEDPNCTHIEPDSSEEVKEVENLSDFPTAQLPEENNDPNSSAIAIPTETEVKKTDDSQMKENPNYTEVNEDMIATGSCEAKDAENVLRKKGTRVTQGRSCKTKEVKIVPSKKKTRVKRGKNCKELERTREPNESKNEVAAESSFPTLMETEDIRTDDSKIKENPQSTAGFNVTTADRSVVKEADHCSAFPTSQPSEETKTDISKIEESANYAFPIHVDTPDKINVGHEVKEYLKTAGNEESEVITPWQLKETERSSDFPTAQSYEDTKTDDSEIKENPNCVPNFTADVNVTAADSCEVKKVDHFSVFPISQPCEDSRTSKIEENDNSAFPTHVDTENERNVSSQIEECPKTTGNEASEVITPRQAKEADHSSTLPTAQTYEDIRTDKSENKDTPISNAEVNDNVTAAESCETKEVKMFLEVLRKKDSRGRKCKKFVQNRELKEPNNEVEAEVSFPTPMKTEDKRIVDSKIKENTNSTAFVNVKAAESCDVKEPAHFSDFLTSQSCKETITGITQIKEDLNSAFPTCLGTEENRTDDRRIKNVDTEPERKVCSQDKEYPNTTDNEVMASSSCQAKGQHSSAFRAVQPSEVIRTDSQVEEHPNFPGEENEFKTTGSSTADNIEFKEESVETNFDAGIKATDEARPALVPNESIIIETIDDPESIIFQEKIDDQLIDGEQKISEAPENPVAIENDVLEKSDLVKPQPFLLAQNTSQNKECIVGNSASETNIFDVETPNTEDTFKKVVEVPDHNLINLKSVEKCTADTSSDEKPAQIEKTELVDQTADNNCKDLVTLEVVSFSTLNMDEKTLSGSKEVEWAEDKTMNHINGKNKKRENVDSRKILPKEKNISKPENIDQNGYSEVSKVTSFCEYLRKHNITNYVEIMDILKALHVEKIQIISNAVVSEQESEDSSEWRKPEERLETSNDIAFQNNPQSLKKQETCEDVKECITDTLFEATTTETKKVDQTVKNKGENSLNLEKVVSVATSNNREEVTEDKTTKKRCKPAEQLEEEIVTTMRRKRLLPKTKNKREEIPSRKVLHLQKEISKQSRRKTKQKENNEETSFCEFLKKHNISNYIEIVNQLKDLSAKKNTLVNSASIVSKNDEKSDSDIEIIDDEKKTRETSQTIRNVFINLESQEKSDDFKFESIYRLQPSSKKQDTFQEPALNKKRLERKKEKRQERKNEKMEEKFLMSNILALHEEFRKVQNNRLGHFPILPFQFGQPSTSSNFLNPHNPFMQAPFSRSHRINEKNMPGFGNLPPHGYWPMDNRLPQPSFPQGVQTEKQDDFPHLTNDLPSFRRGFKRKQRSSPKEKKRRK